MIEERKSKRRFRSGLASESESEDRFEPTIVNEAKVGDGLRQLRSWYQREDQSHPDSTTGNPAAAPTNSVGGPQPPVTDSSVGGPQARPTAIGHATAPPASAAQRPIAPDPMRATMYGRDGHQLDVDLPATGAEPTPPASSTIAVPADPGSSQHAITQQVGAVRAAVGWPQSDSLNVAGGDEAERLPWPTGRRRSRRDIRSQTRVPVTARVMFGVGMAAFVVAIAMWLLSGSDPDSSSAEPSPAAIPTSPARTTPRAAAPGAMAVPPAVTIPNVAAPKIGARAPTTPARLRTPRNPREVKVEPRATKLQADTDDTLPLSEE